MKIIHHDAEGEFIVIDKPGSIVSLSLVMYPAFNLTMQPVHAAGRYFRHTLVEILKNEFGYEKIFSTFAHMNASLMLHAISVFLVSCEPLR